MNPAVINRISQALQRNPSWKIIVRNDAWLCPYCAKIGARQLSSSQAIERRIAEHLLNECPACQRFTGTEQSLDQLRTVAKMIVFKIQIGKWMISDARYSVSTDDGDWLCPCCGVVTNVQVPEADPSDPASYGLAPEEHPFLAATARHFLQCVGFNKQQVLSANALETLRKRANEKARSGNVKQRFAREPEWQLLDQERHWLCPFCANSTKAEFPNSGPNDQFFNEIGAHVMTCTAYRTLRGKPRPVKYLKEKVARKGRNRRLEQLRRKIGARAIWRCHDSNNSWYCPYCARGTNIEYPQNSAVESAEFEAFTTRVLNHLRRCSPYKSKSAIKPDHEMKAVVDEANDDIKRIKALKRTVKKDERFQVITDDRVWVCPYCVTTVEEVEINSIDVVLNDNELFEVVADSIFDHWAECDSYTPGKSPRANIDEVRAEMFMRSQELASEDELGVTQITSEYDRLKQDVEMFSSTEDDSGEAMLASLESAKLTRKRLLPNLPSLAGYDFAAEQIASEQLGGDFYDFFQVNDQVLGVVVGGISDQGVQATLTMGLTKKLLQTHGRRFRTCTEVLETVNADILDELDEDTYVSVFFGFLNIANRAFMFARAGQNPLIVFNANRQPSLTLFQTKGMALGMDDGKLFKKTLEQRRIQLAAGDVLVQLSAGVTAATNDQGEAFGLERVQKVIETYGRESAEYIAWKVRKSVQEWIGNESPNEDLTLVAVKLL